MSIAALPKHRMNVPEFLIWANEQLDTNYELVNGEVVAMAPDRIHHNLVKFAAARALEDAVRAAALPCTVFTDGVGVVINDNTTRIPDASVQCGKKLNLKSMVLEAPLIVLEVSSRSTERQDAGAKLIEYFSVPSIRHYLIVVPESRAVLHHMRNDDGTLSTYIGRSGDIVLNPPGITVPVTGLVGPSFEEDAEAVQ